MSAALTQSGNVITAGRDVVNLTVGYQESSASLAEERNKIIKWLFEVAAVNHYAIQNETYAKRAPGTAAWILEKPEFNAWLARRTGVFWGVGIPGSGKTVLTSFVIHHLESSSAAQKTNNIIIFAYSRFDDNLSVKRVLAALLGQLVKKSDVALKCMNEQLYSVCMDKGVKPTEDDIITHLQAVTDSVSDEIIVVIDALDELRDDIRQRLLDVLLALKRPIFLTSREILLEGLAGPDIYIRAPEGDFNSFIDREVRRLPKLWSLLEKRKEVMDEIITELTLKSDGMFLLAALQLSTLGEITTVKSLRKALAILPTKLLNMYELNLKRILNQEEEEHTLACHAILWVTRARRPLKTPELLEALALEPDSTELDPDALTNEKTLMSVCCGLLTIEQETKKVRMIHYTAHDFFLSQRWGLFEHPHTVPAAICAVYIRLSQFHSQKVANYDDLELLNESYPFAIYACAYLGHHTVHSAQEWDGQIPAIVYRHLSGYSPIMIAPVYAITWGVIAQVHYGTMTHFAALHGLLSIIKTTKEGLNEKSQDGYTPLFYAVIGGHNHIVEWLLSREGVNANEPDNQGQTLLMMASSKDHTAVVQLLLTSARTDFNLQDNFGRTALHMACELGYDATARLLLNSPGIKVNPQDEAGMTPLHLACIQGHKPVIQLLLSSPGINVNPKDSLDQTPLHFGCLAGNIEVVQLLLGNPQIDVNARSMVAGTALHEACLQGDLSLVELLLASPNIVINTPTELGKSPLALAAINGHNAIVELLQRNGVVD